MVEEHPQTLAQVRSLTKAGLQQPEVSEIIDTTAHEGLAKLEGEKVVSVLSPSTPLTSMDAMQSRDRFSCVVYDRSNTLTSQRPFVTMPLLASTSRDDDQTGCIPSHKVRQLRDNSVYAPPAGLNPANAQIITTTHFNTFTNRLACPVLPPTTGTALSTISEDTEESTLAGDDLHLRGIIPHLLCESTSTALKNSRSSDEFGRLDTELCIDDLLQLVEQDASARDQSMYSKDGNGINDSPPALQLPTPFPSSMAMDLSARGDRSDVVSNANERVVNDDEWMMLDNMSDIESIDLS
ncbi:hypothetical protein LTS18_000185, partial [Coniosporium uncinatum]